MEMCEHLTLGVIYSHPACGTRPTQEELECHALYFLAHIEYRRQHPKQPGDEGYEFWKEYQQP